MRSGLALIFRTIFKVEFLKRYYFGLYKKLFLPYNLFKGVSKNINYQNKFLLQLEIEDWISQNIYFLNTYEEKEIKFIEEFLKPGNCFIDVGANIGLFSLAAAKIIGRQGKVLAFEPFKRNYEILTHHIQLNKLTNIQAENLALSDVNAKKQLHLNEKEKNFGMVSGYLKEYTHSQEVFAVSLDAYFVDHISVPVHLIKIDIEGAEYFALRGMQATLKKYTPTLLIEINPDGSGRESQKETIEAFLFDMGYKRYFLSENGSMIKQKLENDDSNNFVFSTQIVE